MTGVTGIGKAIEIEIDVLKKPLFRTELEFAGTDRVVVRTPLQNDVSQYRYNGPRMAECEKTIPSSGSFPSGTKIVAPTFSLFRSRSVAEP